MTALALEFGRALGELEGAGAWSSRIARANTSPLMWRSVCSIARAREEQPAGGAGAGVAIARPSLDDGPGNRGRLAPSEEPAGRGGGQRHADDCEREIQERHVAQVAEVVVVRRSEGDVGAGDA